MLRMLPKQARYQTAPLPDRGIALRLEAGSGASDIGVRGIQRRTLAERGDAGPGIVPEDVRESFCASARAVAARA
jgi:hypothetical protein